MSKAVVIIDMPKSCDMCDFVDDGESRKLWCGLPTYGYEVTDYIACRPDDCPLREMPEKSHTGKSDYYQWGDWEDGWNACIDELLTDEKGDAE